MNNQLHRAWAEVDLSAIAHNMREVRRITNPNSRIMAVVKADAYGHGFLAAAKTLAMNGADYFGVAILEEAEQLRREGLSQPIMILGATDARLAPRLVEGDIIPAVIDEALPQALSAVAVRLNKRARVHIKVDTGMNRLGFLSEAPDTVNRIIEISRLPNLELDGIFTHLANSDKPNDDYTNMQFARFMKLCERLRLCGLHIPAKHICNSGGILQYPDMHLDIVRPGIVLYGCYPSPETNNGKITLRPAMSLCAAIAHIKEIGAQQCISYGGAYITKGITKIATVPLGYADGFSRILSGRAQMMVRNEKVSVVGKICMDQCMIDVTNVHNISVGDEVRIFGAAEAAQPVEEIARLMGTVNYEVLCVIGKRIPRVYIQDGKIIEVLDYLE